MGSPELLSKEVDSSCQVVPASTPTQFDPSCQVAARVHVMADYPRDTHLVLLCNERGQTR